MKKVILTLTTIEKIEGKGILIEDISFPFPQELLTELDALKQKFQEKKQ